MLRIKDLRNGGVLPKPPVHGVVSLAWAQDGQNLFYTVSDANQRPYRVLCTKLGSDNRDDGTVFTEDDSSFCVDITSTKDGKFITVNSNSRTSSEVYVINANTPLEGLQRMRRRVHGVQYFVEHYYGLFYILTNAPLSENTEWSRGGYYLARCSVEDMQSADWENIILPSEDISLQDMDIFDGNLVLSLNRKGVPALCSINLPVNLNHKCPVDIEDLNPWFFPLPSDACSILPGSNHDFMNSVYRAVLSSPVMPDLIVDYDMSNRTFAVVQQEELGGTSANKLDNNKLINTKSDDRNYQNFEWLGRKDFSCAYCCERKEVVSHDGISVPLTILYSEKAWKKGQSPGLLQAYGAYGEVLDKSWSADRLSLLDRGWTLAFADVRGGGGADSSWHKLGTGFHKKNSIFDFISCANYLVTEGYVCKDRLAAIGYSAGCLLPGAAINMYPRLFRAAVLKVPFLDICNTLLDPDLPLTTLDYEEFGNPRIPSQFEYIRSYSPNENINSRVCYPSMLVAASFHDSRVGVWEAAKWVAKIRDITCPSCSPSVILKTNMSGGHFGEGGRYSQCEETACDYAFLIKTCGSLQQ